MTTPRSGRALATAAVFAAGFAAASPARAQASEAPQPQCDRSPLNGGGIPALAQLADSAALAAALGPALAAHGPSALVLAFGPSGEPRGVRFVRSPLAPSVRDSVRSRVQAVLRRLPPRNASEGGKPSWEVQMDVGGASAPRLSLGGIESCRAALRNPRKVIDRLHHDIHRAVARGLRLDHPAVTEVRMAVSVDGTASDAEIGRSSGSPELDRIALAAAKRAAFVPASIGGKPISSHVWLPINFQLAP